MLCTVPSETAAVSAMARSDSPANSGAHRRAKATWWLALLRIGSTADGSWDAMLRAELGLANGGVVSAARAQTTGEPSRTRWALNRPEFPGGC